MGEDSVDLFVVEYSSGQFRHFLGSYVHYSHWLAKVYAGFRTPTEFCDVSVSARFY